MIHGKFVTNFGIPMYCVTIKTGALNVPICNSVRDNQFHSERFSLALIAIAIVSCYRSVSLCTMPLKVIQPQCHGPMVQKKDCVTYSNAGETSRDEGWGSNESSMTPKALRGRMVLWLRHWTVSRQQICANNESFSSVAEPENFKKQKQNKVWSQIKGFIQPKTKCFVLFPKWCFLTFF